MTTGNKVGIIGAGLVGAAAGYLLTTFNAASEIVLIDKDEARARSEAADIAHAAAFGRSVDVRSGTWDDLKGAAVIIITAGVSLKPGETRLELAAKNVRIMADIMPHALRAAPNAVFLFATNPVDILPSIAVRHFGVPRERAIGTGCALDTARFCDHLARYFGIASQSINAFVLGEHGDSEVLHWSGAQIAGISLVDFAARSGKKLGTKERLQISEDVRTSAYRIKEGKGVSNFGIGGCIARLTSAIIRDEHMLFTVSTPVDEILGVTNTCISLPHVLGRKGATMPTLPLLDDNEEKALRASAIIIRDAIAAAEKDAGLKT